MNDIEKIAAMTTHPLHAEVNQLLAERDDARAWAKAWKRAAKEFRESYTAVYDDLHELIGLP